MPVYVALLRAINVGGTGKLPMTDLRTLCENAGFESVSTYIQTGNVILASPLSEPKVKATLEKALAVKMGKPTGAMVRTTAELHAVVRRNPFPAAEGNRIIVLFLDEAPPKSALAGLPIPGREEVKVLGREIFIHYPDGQGRSKLKIPFAKTGTGRNLNTVEKLAAMGEELLSRTKF